MSTNETEFDWGGAAVFGAMLLLLIVGIVGFLVGVVFMGAVVVGIASTTVVSLLAGVVMMGCALFLAGYSYNWFVSA